MTGKQNRTMLIVILCLAVAAAFVAFNRRIPTSYGLDIRGGVRVVLRAKTEEYERRQKKSWTPDKLESVRMILENRVNTTGVAEPVIITKPKDQIIVELPGLKNEQEAIDRLQSTASLQFYLLRQLGDKNGGAPAQWTVSQTKNAKGESDDVLINNATGKPLTDGELDANVFSKDPLVTGEDLLPQCKAEIQPGTNQAVITFQFNDKGSRIFEETTRANQGRFLAIFLDKKLLTAPSINSVIPGNGIIEGNFTLESAKSLADQLNAGALPVPLEVLEKRKLEATLGAEAVRATTMAGAVGLGLVLVFMLWFYRLPGVLADVALVLYALFSVALFKLWPITLTLPGIAGFILSIGMAVDANILIFERMKEELKSGKTLRASIDSGFKRAFTAILDSNVCTLITCAVLYNFGTGPIRGFAITLGLGVVVSMFTAITVTRTFLFALVGVGAAQNAGAFGLNSEKDRQYNLKTMSRKGLWLAISGVLVAVGMVFWAMGGIKPSIDFRGGTELQVPFAQRHSSEQIQSALAKVNPRYRDSRVVVSGGGAGADANLAYVTTERLTDQERGEVINTLLSSVGPLANGQTATNVSYSDVSGTISRELTFNAVQAVIYASILIVLFLAIRFSIGGFVEGLKYGLCAVIALLHDVAVVWGAFAILGKLLNWQVDSLFVTAMLTVIGFSVHDTIIVFDRIRENLQHRGKGEAFSQLADRSIDQTLTRSIRTSFTVVLVLAALFFFGGGQVHQFVGALLIGIISGTYSSIFNASVLLVMAKRNDTGLAYASGPRATSQIGARPQTTLPGDRPLVTPKNQPAAAGAGGGTARIYGSGDGNGTASRSSDGTDGEPETRSRPTPRKQPIRRRRM